jgi:hypothetical protein
MHIDCTPFPNTRVFWTARKTRDGFRGVVTTVEVSAWSPSSWARGRFVSDITRPSRADAIQDAETAAREAARTGYVPTF